MLAPLGPFEERPRLAVGVSGGADSMALALLAARWAADCGGVCEALIVDHGLRPDSAAEATLACARLQAVGIAARVLTLTGLHPGSALAARARTARLEALEADCAASGVLHLLLGHHAADQAETVAMRMLRASHADGLAGMAALKELRQVRLLRPLLPIPPVRLRQTLLASGVAWNEDPSNADPRWQRARLRALRRDADGIGPATRGAVAAAVLRGQARAVRERARATWLGRHATLHPAGWIVLDALPPEPEYLADALRAVSGAAHRALPEAARFLARPHAATLGGVALRQAPEGWTLTREIAAAPPADHSEPWSPPVPVAGGEFVTSAI